MNLKVVLIRHGRTAWNRERRFLGTTDIGLDAQGWSQARRIGLATHGRFDAVYASPLSRASETASCLSDEVTKIAELMELAQGELEGLHAAEAMSRYPAFFQAWKADPTSVAPPGGETLGSCRDRGLGALSRITREHLDGGVVAVVTHQLLIASTTCTIDGSPLVRWSEYCVENCSGVTLEWDGVNWKILRGDLFEKLLSVGPGSGATDV